MSNKSRIEQNNIKINNNTNKIQSVANAVNTLSGITKTEYNACLTLVDSIDNIDDYSETTATAEDIKKGKTAYCNGELVTGAMEVNESNILIDGSVATSLNFEGLGAAVKKINFDKIDTSKCTSISLAGCTSLINIEGTIDTSNVSNFSTMFQNCSSLTNFPISHYPQPSKKHYAKNMFYKCTGLTGEVTCTYNYVVGSPSQYDAMFGFTSIDTIKMQGTSGANPPNTNLKQLCYGCSKLVNVIFTNEYVLSLNCQEMFYDCPNLSDESLNNILLAASRTTNNATKTLKYLGLSNAQIAKCQTLSNYQAFLDAGWTTGY